MIPSSVFSLRAAKDSDGKPRARVDVRGMLRGDFDAHRTRRGEPLVHAAFLTPISARAAVIVLTEVKVRRLSRRSGNSMSNASSIASIKPTVACEVSPGGIEIVAIREF